MEQSLFPQLVYAPQWSWVPALFVLAWALIGFLVWTLSVFIRDLLQITQRMHRIPCANCRFFTGDYHLKCTVRPTVALTEEAIHCSDFQV
jgi:hypothetical protein